jgi:hypothetical protein
MQNRHSAANAHCDPATFVMLMMRAAPASFQCFIRSILRMTAGIFRANSDASTTKAEPVGGCAIKYKKPTACNT